MEEFFKDREAMALSIAATAPAMFLTLPFIDVTLLIQA